MYVMLLEMPVFIKSRDKNEKKIFFIVTIYIFNAMLTCTLIVFVDIRKYEKNKLEIILDSKREFLSVS